AAVDDEDSARERGVVGDVRAPRSEAKASLVERNGEPEALRPAGRDAELRFVPDLFAAVPVRHAIRRGASHRARSVEGRETGDATEGNTGGAGGEASVWQIGEAFSSGDARIVRIGRREDSHRGIGPFGRPVVAGGRKERVTERDAGRVVRVRL